MVKLIIELLREFGLDLGFFRLIDYLTFRIIIAIITSLSISIIFGHRFIYYMYKKNFKDTSGEFMSIAYGSKRGTPTMGGIFISLTTLISVFLWGDLSNIFVLVLILSLIYFTLLGVLDDYFKAKFKSSIAGLTQKIKTLLMLLFIVPFSLFYISDINPIDPSLKTVIFLPFIKNPVLDIGNVFYVIFIIVTFFAIVNAVNFTDGMDGLLAGLSLMNFSVYIVFAYLTGSSYFAKYFFLANVPEALGITVFLSALMGSIIGFLWFNFYPAEIFMGDTGSLAIGSTISITLFFIKQEFLFLIVGGVFVLEALTSFLNDKIANMKYFGRRIVYRAPYHYTLRHKGLSEPKAVARLLIVGFILALIGLISIKIR